MAEDFASKSLKSSVAQLCVPLGWQNANTSAVEVSNDVVKRFIHKVGTLTSKFAEFAGRNEGNLDDLALSFDMLGIRLPELEEYLSNVELPHFASKAYSFPVKHSNSHVFEKTRRTRKSKSFKSDGDGDNGESDSESDDDILPPYLPPLPDKAAYENEDDRESGIHVSDTELPEAEIKEQDPFSLGQSGLPQFLHKRLRSISVDDEEAADTSELKTPQGGVKSPLGRTKSPPVAARSPPATISSSPKSLSVGGFYSPTNSGDDAGGREGFPSKKVKGEKIPYNKGLPIPGRHPSSSSYTGKSRKERSESSKAQSHKLELTKTPKIKIKLPKVLKGNKSNNSSSPGVCSQGGDEGDAITQQQHSLSSVKSEFEHSQSESKWEPELNHSVLVVDDIGIGTVAEGKVEEDENTTSLGRDLEQEAPTKVEFEPFTENSRSRKEFEQHQPEESPTEDSTNVEELHGELSFRDNQTFATTDDMSSQLMGGGEEFQSNEQKGRYEDESDENVEIDDNYGDDDEDDDDGSIQDEFIDVGEPVAVESENASFLPTPSDTDSSVHSLSLRQPEEEPPLLEENESLPSKVKATDEEARMSFQEEGDNHPGMGTQRRIQDHDVLLQLSSVSDSSDDSSGSDFSSLGADTPMSSAKNSPSQKTSQQSLLMGVGSPKQASSRPESPQETFSPLLSSQKAPLEEILQERTPMHIPLSVPTTLGDSRESSPPVSEQDDDDDDVYTGRPILAPTPGLIVQSLGTVEQVPASGLVVKIPKKGLRVPSKRKGQKRPHGTKKTKASKRPKTTAKEETVKVQSVSALTGSSESPPTLNSTSPLPTTAVPGLVVTRTGVTATSSQKLFQGKKPKSPSVKQKEHPKQHPATKSPHTGHEVKLRIRTGLDGQVSSDVGILQESPIPLGVAGLSVVKGGGSTSKTKSKKKKKKKEVSIHKKKSKSKGALSGLTVSTGKIKQVSPLAMVSTKMATSHSSPKLKVTSGSTIKQTPVGDVKISPKLTISTVPTPKLTIKTGAVTSFEGKLPSSSKDSDDSSSSDSSSDEDVSDDGSSASSPSVTMPSSGLIVQSSSVLLSSSVSQPLSQTTSAPLVYYCPVCKQPDDGRPMVACDMCNDDRWYHWVCVGITKPPKESDPWFCPDCVKKTHKKKRSSGR